MSTIPASEIVNVTPNVLQAGGSAIDLNGLFLTNGTRVPIGSVLFFASAAAVSSYFGPAAQETLDANTYFGGFDSSNKKPGSLLFAQYNTSNVSAFLRGGSLVAMTLAQLQALNGTLSVTIDGVVKSSTVNLASATSFANAAQIIADTLDIEGAQAASFTGAISGTTLTVSALSTGALAVGQFVKGAGVTADTYITALGTGTGGTGTYTVSNSQTVASEAMTTNVPNVTFDSVQSAFVVTSSTTGTGSTITFATGTIAASLDLTSATGAVTSQGALAATPSAFMNALTQLTQNWATFRTTFDPDNGSGNANKLLFAQWVSGTNNRYTYICSDSDPNPTTQNPATSSLGQLIKANSYSGTCLIWEPSLPGAIGPFVCGAVASIDFTQLNGRSTLAFKSQSGLNAGVTTQTAADNLRANNYNYYGAYGTANTSFVFFFPGSVSGNFLWLDSYINQIWLNNNFQLALMQLLTQVKSIPYNAQGRTMIQAALASTIQQALNFGLMRAGVTLSASQIAAVNAAAGLAIDNTLATQGWYLQVLNANPTVRQARGSPPCNFWYMDGESVQQINLTSTDIL